MGRIILRQHRTIWQEHSAKDFASYESYKRAGILYVFPSFITARMGQKIGRRPQTQLCGAALKFILLPLLLAVLLLQWAMTFAIQISAWVFDLAAGLIALVCVASALLGLFPWADQVPQLLLALALFLVPYLATWLTMRLISLRFFLQSRVFA